MADTDKQEKQAEEVAEKGRFIALENGDNAITVEEDGDAYLGVDLQYRNHADDARKPYKATDDDETAKAQEERAANWVFNNDPDAGRRNVRTGYVTEVRHPSEKRETAVDKAIEAERSVRDALVRNAGVKPAEKQGEQPSGRRAPAKD
jgi:hypothetical protein